MSDSPFSADYYRTQGIEGDRIALAFYARLVRRLRPQGGQLLEFGCGTGHLLKRLAGPFEAFGYDISPQARAEAARVAPRARIVDYIDQIPQGTLHAVVSLHTLEHIAEPGPLLDRLARLLRPGGLFFAVVPNPNGLGHRLKKKDWFAYRDPTHCSVLTAARWHELLERSGFRLDWIGTDGLWDAPYVAGIPVLLQKALFGAPAAVQVLLGRAFLPVSLGECLILVAARRRD